MTLNIISSIFITSTLSRTPTTLGIIVFSLATIIIVIIIIQITSIIIILVFLIYIGGLIVIFSYFLSLEPNLQIDFNPITIRLLFNIFYLYFLPPIFNYHSLITQFNSNITILLLISKWEILLLLTIILLLSLIIVGSILSKFWGPIRPYFLK